MANSRISDLNKITSLDPADDMQGSGMFLVANKKVGCEHIEYRDLKSTITDHTVFTTGNQLNILGNKTFKGTVTFQGGHTDGSTGPLSELAQNLFATGQTLNSALGALDLDHDADSIKTNLFNSGQLLNDLILDNAEGLLVLHDNLVIDLFTTGKTLNDEVVTNAQGIVTSNANLSALNDNVVANTQGISSTNINLFTTGQTLNDKVVTNAQGIASLEGNLFTTGQTLNDEVVTNAQDIGSLESNLFTTGQTLNDEVVTNAQGVASLETNLFTTGQTLNDKVVTNVQGIATLEVGLFATGQDLFSMIDTHSARHEVTTLTASQGMSAPTVSGDLIKSRTEKITVSGQNVFISGQDVFSVAAFSKSTISSNEIEMIGATKINLSSPVVTIGEDVFIKGDLFVSGETVTLNVANLSIEDKTIELSAPTTGSDGTAATAVTNNITADGAGIIVKSSAGDKTWLWEKDTLSWESNQIISTEGSFIIKNPTSPPATSSYSGGEIGEMRWNDNYLYVKTNNGWRRALLMDW